MLVWISKGLVKSSKQNRISLKANNQFKPLKYFFCEWIERGKKHLYILNKTHKLLYLFMHLGVGQFLQLALYSSPFLILFAWPKNLEIQLLEQKIPPFPSLTYHVFTKYYQHLPSMFLVVMLCVFWKTHLYYPKTMHIFCSCVTLICNNQNSSCGSLPNTRDVDGPKANFEVVIIEVATYQPMDVKYDR